MPDRFREKYQVRTVDADFDNHLTISSLCSVMGEVALKHATQLSFGIDDLRNNGLFWVLSRLYIEFDHFPQSNEIIIIETWPKETQRLFAMRDYRLLSSTGNVIANATSGWLMIDAKTMMPVRPDTYFEKRNLKFEEKGMFNDCPGKITESSDKSLIIEREVRYSDIDINKHMNSARYMELISDCFDPDFYKSKMFRSLQINFISECKYGDIIQVLKGDISGEEFYIEGYNKNNQKIVFQSLVNIRNK